MRGRIVILAFVLQDGINRRMARCQMAGACKSLIRLVAGGGFEPHLSIDNRQLIDFVSGIKSNKDTMS
jgi:hypothetical protein